MQFRIIDLETTGFAPPAEVVELAIATSIWGHSAPMAWLYRPVHGIPLETKAVHHLCESDFGLTTFPCSPANLCTAINHQRTPDALVARNRVRAPVPHPRYHLDDPWICTCKVAMHVWPNAPEHSNQVLRYWLGLNLNPILAMPPHRAGPQLPAPSLEQEALPSISLHSTASTTPVSYWRTKSTRKPFQW